MIDTMTIEWTGQQKAALKAVQDYLWNPQGRDWFYLGGYAGTGKTTLAKTFAETTPGAVVAFATYTGKAALVLQQKGCKDATTIDKLIYRHPSFWKCVRPVDKDAAPCVRSSPQFCGEQNYCKFARQIFLQRELNSDALNNIDMVIVDEVSMVNEELGDALLSFRKPILVLGDPGQLPPIAGAGFFTSREPDLMLTEIVRQALDNPIIRLSKFARFGTRIPYGQYGDSSCIPMIDKSEYDQLLTFDRIIVGTNATRVSMNRETRRLHGYDPNSLPQRGEPVICLQNSLINDKKILNGQLFEVVDAYMAKGKHGFMEMELLDKDNNQEKSFIVLAREDYFNNINPDKEGRGVGQLFDFGYAITAHKSQGSEWDKVAVIDESYVFHTNRKKWLYTAITRAKESVVIMRTK